MSDAERDATERGERVQAENARLRTRVGFLESLFEHAPVALYVHDLDGRFVEVNAAACQATGRTRDALLAGHVADLGDEWTPQSVSAWAHGLTPFRVEVRDRLARRGDRSVATQTRVTRIDTDDRSCVLAAVRDLSEQRSAEARHRALVETTLMGVYLIQDTRFVYVNDKAEELLGHSRTELLEMPSFLDVIADEDKASIEALRDERIAGNTGPFTYNLRVRRKDGTVVHLDVHSIATDYQDRLAVLGTINDVTAQKALEAQVLQSRQRLRNLAARLHAVREEERSTMSREIHDELGQSLTGLKIDLFWLNEHLPARSARLRERAQSMLGLLDQTIERVRNMSWRLRPALLDDLGLDAAVEWLVQDFGSRTGCACDLSIPETLPPIDATRATAVFRVLQEALTNVASQEELERAGGSEAEPPVQRHADGVDPLGMVVGDPGRRTVGASPWRPGGRCAPEPRTQPIAPLFDLGSFLR